MSILYLAIFALKVRHHGCRYKSILDASCCCIARQKKKWSGGLRVVHE